EVDTLTEEDNLRAGSEVKRQLAMHGGVAVEKAGRELAFHEIEAILENERSLVVVDALRLLDQLLLAFGIEHLNAHTGGIVGGKEHHLVELLVNVLQSAPILGLEGRHLADELGVDLIGKERHPDSADA